QSNLQAFIVDYSSHMAIQVRPDVPKCKSIQSYFIGGLMPQLKILIVLLLSVSMFHAYAQESAMPAVDAQVESKLDDVLNRANPETSLQELQSIKTSLTPETPLMTRV